MTASPFRLPPSSSRPLRACLCALGLLASACGAAGRYVWVDEYAEAQQQAGDGNYQISPGDRLYVRVWNQENLTSTVRVRADGRISLMFLNDVDAAGYSPSALAQQLQTRLKDFINNPVVTVQLEESQQITISMLGEVSRTGVHQMAQGAGLLQALAAAGGFTDYAHKDRIFVLRQEAGSATPVRIRFRYEQLIHAEGRAPAFRLRSGDVIVVE